MKKIHSFDFSVKNYDFYQDNIKNLYPGEHLTLSTLKKDNGYTDVEVKAYFGSVGFLFGEDGNEILKYIENPTMYYIDTYVKKFLIKDAIKLALVVIIDVYEKDENFVEPKYEFLGDYHTDSKKYIWGEIMDEISPMKCSVSGINNFPHIAEELGEWEDCKLVINGDVLDVYSEQGSKFGNLSKQASQKLIPYLKNPDNFLTVNISSIRQNDDDKWSCRLEISIHEKRQTIEERKKQEKEQQKQQQIKAQNDTRDAIWGFIIALIIIFIIYKCSS